MRFSGPGSFAKIKNIWGASDLARRGFTANDAVVGLSCSGSTPYVLGALRKAKMLGAAAVAVICNPDGTLAQAADVAIRVVTGPEVIAGSTRMKAGTAEKMVLNMLSTATMIRTGRVFGNTMADMQISCKKLEGRAVQIITPCHRRHPVESSGTYFKKSWKSQKSPGGSKMPELKYLHIGDSAGNRMTELLETAGATVDYISLDDYLEHDQEEYAGMLFMPGYFDWDSKVKDKEAILRKVKKFVDSGNSLYTEYIECPDYLFVHNTFKIKQNYPPRPVGVGAISCQERAFHHRRFR